MEMRILYKLINNQIMRINVFIGIFSLLLVGCVAQQSGSDKAYHENLAVLRPKMVIPPDSAKKETTTQPETHTQLIASAKPTHTVNDQVDAVLDSIDRYNLTRKFVDGYTIQIYSGQSRDQAMDAKNKMANQIPELSANLQYQQPKFRVTVGKYYSKLEAHQDLVRLRNNFSAAILVPEKIQIK